MKKMILGVMVLLGFGATQVSAQSTTFGIKAEANMSNFILDDLKGQSSNMGFGATLGGFAKFDITRGFAIQPELLFNYQNSEMKIAGKKHDYEYWGMEIPVYAMGQWYGNTGNRFYAGVGPFVGYGFSAKYTKPETKLYDKDVLQPWDFGFKATVGYEFRCGVSINAGYKLGVINAVDKGNGTMLPETISLGVGYRF